MRRTVAVVLAMALLVTACGGGKHAAGPKKGSFLITNFLPFGFKITRGSLEQAGPAVETYAVAVGRPAKNGFTDVVRVLVKPTTADRVPPATEKDTPVAVNGVQARLHTDVGGTSVDWFKNGLLVAVTGSPTTDDTAIVTDVARRVRLASSKPSGASLAGAPAQYSVIASSYFVAHAPEAGYVLVLSGSPGVAVSMFVFATRAPQIFGPGLGGVVETTKVRGHTAYVSRNVQPVSQTATTPQNVVDWYERSGALVALVGNVPVDKLLPIAEGVASVSQDEWLRRVPLEQGGP